MKVELDKIDLIFESLKRIRILQSDSITQLSNNGLDTVLEEVLRIETKLQETNDDLDLFTEHLHHCIQNDFFSKFPVKYHKEEFAIISYGFNTYIEELEYNVVTRDNFELIFNTIAHHIIVFDHKDEIRYINHPANEFYKQGNSENLNSIVEILPIDFINQITHFKSGTLNKYEFNYSWNLNDEKLTYLHYKLFKISFEGKKQILIIGKDITSQKEEEVRILSATYNGQEMERKRLALEIHDSIGQELSSLKMNINSIQNTNPSSERYQEVMINLDEIIRNAVQTVKDISFNLKPTLLTKLNLRAAIVRLIEVMSNSSLKITLNCVDKEIKLKNKQEELFVYRVIQEFLNNTFKHASASLVTIVVRKNKARKQFKITLADNGIGFDLNNTSTLNGNGLANIYHRLKILNTDYTFNSVVNKGTHLEFYISY
jgi:signal transduction histidine kinase